MKIRVLSFILAILFILSLLSCGKSAPANDPAAPETAVAPEEKYPVQVPCEYGLIYPVVEQESLVKIVSDRETLDAYRQKYDAMVLDRFSYFFSEYPDAVEDFLPKFLTNHVNSANAFAICDKEDFFERNILVIAVTSVMVGDEFEKAECKMVQNEDGEEKLEITLHCMEEFGSDEYISKMVVVSLPNDLDIDYETDIIVTRK